LAATGGGVRFCGGAPMRSGGGYGGGGVAATCGSISGFERLKD